MNDKIVERFTQIHDRNEWGSKESVSGTGSTLEATKKLMNELRLMMYKYKIKSILDAPCGDVNWMNKMFRFFEIQGISYTGMDIVETIVRRNKTKYPETFIQGDLTSTTLPQVDLVFVRDCLGHLPIDMIEQALRNIKESGSKWLLVTSFTKFAHVANINLGDWQPINLMIAPFRLVPEYLINEDCQEGYQDKCMILVDIQKMKL